MRELVVGGWLVLRFSWSQVMTRPEWVRSVLVRAVALREVELRLPAWGRPPRAAFRQVPHDTP